MAIFRKIHVTFWSDSFISSLEDKQKLFYLYLLTNERTTQLGVYEITKKQMAFDLGYSIDTVSKLIQSIQKTGKIMYDEKTCEMAIKNWNKYNGNESKKVKVLTDKESANIKNKKLIEYLYSIDTVSIHNPQEEEEEEREEAQNKEEEREQNFERFWNLYGKKEDSKKCKEKFLKLTDSEIQQIFETLPSYILKHHEIKFRKNPLTYLNGKCWNDDCTPPTQNRNFEVSGRTNDGGKFKRFVTHEELEKMKTNSYFKIESVI